MSAAATGTATKLYTPRLLMLSARLADYPFDETLPMVAESRSRTCGSMIKLGVDADDSGRVMKVGMMVTACAVGQSSAAILAGGLPAMEPGSLPETVARIERWLEGDGDPPDWPEFDALIPARAHRGRHGAILLPWKAAIEALSSRAATG